MLRTTVKVNSVNNLSDARYCAGMGVEMIGFSISENHDRYISLEKINGISGWVAGIKIVAESFGDYKPYQLISNAENISAEAIEVDLSTTDFSVLEGKNLLIRFKIHEFEILENKIPTGSILHLGLKREDIKDLLTIATICSKHNTIVNVTELSLDEIEIVLKETNAFGISLDGGNEDSPGLRDFEDLANVLEYLEIQ